jgi:hypothetical protein
VRSLHFAAHALAGATLLFGCAAPPPVNAPRIEPVVSLQHGGSQAEGYFELGRFFQGQGRNAQARDAYRKALALNDRLAEAHNALGTLHAADGAFDQAFAEFGAAIALDPTAAHFSSNLGYAQYLAGRPAEATVTLEQAVALDPANVRARNNLGLARAATAESERSRVAFARAAEFTGAPPPPAAQFASAPVAVRGDTAPAHPDPTIRGNPSPPAPVVGVPPASSRALPPPSATAGDLPFTPIGSMAFGPSAAVVTLEPDPVHTPPSVGVMALAPGASAGTLFPAPTPVLTVVEHAPNLLELKWTGMQVLARPAVAGDARPSRAYGLEVSNGNGITGMAQRVSGLLATVGLPKARLTNQPPYAQRLTEIQFRDGHAGAAASLGARLPNHPVATAVAPDRLRADIDVRLVLGRDLPADVALVEPDPLAGRVAAIPPLAAPATH